MAKLAEQAERYDGNNLKGTLNSDIKHFILFRNGLFH